MDPDGLEDALDLSKDKSQNQVFSLHTRCLVLPTGTRLTQPKGRVHLPARKTRQGRRSTLETKKSLIYRTSGRVCELTLLCSPVEWGGECRERAIAIRYIQGAMVRAGTQDPGGIYWLERRDLADDGQKAILEDVDAGVLKDVLSFVQDTSPQT